MDRSQESISSLATETLQVTAWRARGKTPLAVEITATFVELSLRDEKIVLDREGKYNQWNLDGLGRTESELRMVHAMAIIRLEALSG